MPDPIWLDTNVVIKALNGDPGVNRQLSSFRTAGRQLLITPKVMGEACMAIQLHSRRTNRLMPKS